MEQGPVRLPAVQASSLAAGARAIFIVPLLFITHPSLQHVMFCWVGGEWPITKSIADCSSSSSHSGTSQPQSCPALLDASRPLAKRRLQLSFLSAERTSVAIALTTVTESFTAVLHLKNSTVHLLYPTNKRFGERHARRDSYRCMVALLCKLANFNAWFIILVLLCNYFIYYYRRETARRFVSSHILLSHSRSLEMTLFSRACVSPY